MHICHIMSVPFPPEEGIGNHVFNLSKKLVSKGHNVTIITRNQRNTTQRYYYEGIQVIKVRFIPVYPFYIRFHGIFLNKILNSLETTVDIVHIHSPLCPNVETNLPVIATIHTPMLTDTRFIEVVDFRALMERLMGRFVSAPVERKLLKRADMVITVATSVVDELKEYGIGQENIRVVTNAVDEIILSPSQNINTNCKYILYVGRLGYRKGLFDLIECGKYVCKANPEITFIIVGKGLLSQKICDTISNEGLTNNFKLLGHVNRKELIQLYQNATIFVSPSHYESGPITVLEAMSCGKAVVATSVGLVPDLIVNYINGLVIPPKSPDAMANAIITLLEDEALRDYIGSNARKTIIENYTWDIISSSIEEIYQEVLNL